LLQKRKPHVHSVRFLI